MKIKLNFYNLLIFLIATFSFGTLTYRLVNNIFPMNLIVGGLIFCIVICIFLYEAKIQDVILLLGLFMVIATSLIQSSNIGENINDAIYWTCTVLIVWKLADKAFCDKLFSSIKVNKKYISMIVVINNIILIVGLFQSSCYSLTWGGRYYTGYAFAPHTMSCGACMTLCMTLFVISDFKSTIIKMISLIPCSIAILQSGARTYLIAVIIIWYIYFVRCVDNINIKLVILPIVIVGGVYFIMNSSIMEKFINPNYNTAGIDLDTISNGRAVFWVIDINAYHEGNIFSKLFGNGFDYPYIINEERYNMRIWSHNDFINTLLTSGILGIYIYIVSLIKDYNFLKKYARKNMIHIAIILYFVGVAFINGLFNYQHYLYSYLLIYIYVIYADRLKKNLEKGGA